MELEDEELEDEELEDEELEDDEIFIDGDLDYPPEFLIKIFEASEWNPEIRKLNRYFLDVYNQYGQIKVVPEDNFDLRAQSNTSYYQNLVIKPDKYIQNEWQLDTLKKSDFVKYAIHIVNFIPNNLNGIYSLQYTASMIFNRQPFGTQVNDSFWENNTIKIIDLTEAKIEDEDLISLATSLQDNRTLVSLNLRHNHITDTGIIALAEALITNNTLLSLDLSKNRISSIGITALAETLKVNESLTSLKLNSSNLRLYTVDDTGANALIEALKINKTLKSLSLEHNNITIKGFTALLHALRGNNTLKMLDISEISLSIRDSVKILLKELSFNLKAIIVI